MKVLDVIWVLSELAKRDGNVEVYVWDEVMEENSQILSVGLTGRSDGSIVIVPEGRLK